MSESTSSPVSEGAADGSPGSLPPELIEEVLGDFRAWLQQVAPVPTPEEPPTLDWASVLEGWIGLRQEVNLQTRASRAQLEQNAQTLEQLATAVDTLRRQPPSTATTSADDGTRAVLKALLDAYDSLSLGRAEAHRLQDSLSVATALPPPPEVHVPGWARVLGLGPALTRAVGPVRTWQETRLEELDKLRQQVAALLVGYQMGLQRLERALAQQGLEAIECVGRPFDPETMEATEVTREPGRAETEVIGEVRRGYRWKGRVFRFAQVHVAVPGVPVGSPPISGSEVTP